MIGNFEAENNARSLIFHEFCILKTKKKVKLISLRGDYIKKSVWWRWVGWRLVSATEEFQCEPNLVISVVFLVALGL